MNHTEDISVNKIRSEDDLRKTLINFLRKRGYDDILIEFCLSAGWSIIDLVYLDEKRGFVCIELKLRNWKKVIQQAFKLKSCTPFIYIAMPAFKTSYKRKQVQDEARKLGLGVYWYTNQGMWRAVVQPEKIHYTEGYLSDRVAEKFFKSVHITFLSRCVEDKTLRQLGLSE